LGRAFAICLGAAALGAVLLLLPEDLLGSDPLFSLNERHGPVRADAVGIVVILGGWLILTGLCGLAGAICARAGSRVRSP